MHLAPACRLFAPHIEYVWLVHRQAVEWAGASDAVRAAEGELEPVAAAQHRHGAVLEDEVDAVAGRAEDGGRVARRALLERGLRQVGRAQHAREHAAVVVDDAIERAVHAIGDEIRAVRHREHLLRQPGRPFVDGVGVDVAASGHRDVGRGAGG